MITFRNWLQQLESSPATRARAAAALGLLPLATIGSIHGHSTAPAWQVKAIKKQMKNQRVDRGIDAWIERVEQLKTLLSELKEKVEQKEKTDDTTAEKKEKLTKKIEKTEKKIDKLEAKIKEKQKK